MKPFSRMLLTVLLPIAAWTGKVEAKEATPQGDLVLPAQALVFGPFAREDGVPTPELLRRVPETLPAEVLAKVGATELQKKFSHVPVCTL